MKSKTIYLIYIDILGFGVRAKNIAGEKNIEENLVRKILKWTLDKTIKEIKKTFENVDVKEGSDDYYISIARIENSNPIDQCFEIIQILDNNDLGLHLENNKNLYEIGLTKIEFENLISNNLNELLNTKEFNQVLRFRITEIFKKYYKHENNESIKQTFIVFTENIYNDLSHIEKQLCKSIVFEENPMFFSLDLIKLVKFGKINRFLRITGLARSAYKDIYWIYEKPDQFNKLITILQNCNVLILIGSVGLGKTYTAVKLLFDYFLCDYNPKWINSESYSKVKYIEDYLEDNSIIYFEDPLGKNSYQENEYLEQNFDIILEKIKGKKNLYVIITTRDSIFQSSKLSNYKNINNFTFLLTHSKKPYNEEKIKNIIKNYATKFDCKWNYETELKRKVEETALNLKSPLSISLFCEKTKKICEFNTIENLIYDLIEIDVQKLRDQLKALKEENIVCLIIVLCSEFPIKIEDLKTNFVGFYKFSMINHADIDISKFFGEYIDVLYWEKNIYFTHEYYKSALKYLLFFECPNKYHQIFVKILRYYTQNPDLYYSLSYCLFHYYTYIPQDLKKDIILNLSDKEDTYYYLYGVLSAKLKDLSLDIIDIIFKNMKIDKLTVKDISALILANASILKDEYLNILFKLINNPELCWGVFDSLNLRSNFENLPQNFRKKVVEALIVNYSRSTSSLLIDHYIYGNLKEELRPFIQKIFYENIDPNSVLEFLFFQFPALDEKMKVWFLEILCKKPDLSKDILIQIYDKFENYKHYALDILSAAICCPELLRYVFIIFEECYWAFDPQQRQALIGQLIKKTNKKETIKRIMENNHDDSFNQISDLSSDIT